jgi:spermidine/putrescine transport system substrate-binding protein
VSPSSLPPPFRATVAGVLVAAGAAACGSPAPELPAQIQAFGLTVETARLSPTLRLFNFPEYMDPELVAEFEKRFGTRIVEDYFDTNEAMMARLTAGGTAQFDLVMASDYAVEILAAGGHLEPLDAALLPNRGNLHERFVSPPYDPGDLFAVAFQWGTTGLGVRGDRVAGTDDELATWALLFDPVRGPGRFAFLDDSRETIGAALLFLGYSVNTTDDAELAAAEALLAEAAGRAVAFTPASTGRDLLLAGELDVSHNHSGEIASAAGERPEVRYLVPREGAVVWADNLVIPAGAEGAYTAHVFVNFLLDAQNGARLTEAVRYFSPNLASWEHLDPALRAEHERFLEPGAMEGLEFLADLGADRRKYDQLWTRVKAGSAR